MWFAGPFWRDVGRVSAGWGVAGHRVYGGSTRGVFSAFYGVFYWFLMVYTVVGVMIVDLWETICVSWWWGDSAVSREYSWVCGVNSVFLCNSGKIYGVASVGDRGFTERAGACCVLSPFFSSGRAVFIPISGRALVSGVGDLLSGSRVVRLVGSVPRRGAI